MAESPREDLISQELESAAE